MWELPCPRIPTQATRTVSFALPRTLGERAPAATAVPIKKCLRFIGCWLRCRFYYIVARGPLPATFAVVEETYRQWMHAWEERLCSRATDRVVRPFEWGLEWTRTWPGVNFEAQGEHSEEAWLRLLNAA